MILDRVEALLRKEAEERAERPNNPFRASSAGRCIREGCFDLLGLRGEPLQPRRLLVMKGGSTIHDDLLTPLLKKALGWRFVSEEEWYGPAGKQTSDYVEIDGAKISYHIDGAFQYSNRDVDHLNGIVDSIGIVEIKSMSDFAFNRALKGEIDHDYLCQAWCYFKGTDFNPVVFVAYRKETSAMCEIIFDRHCNERVTTQRLTGDPCELARNDPLLLTEIRSPFDESVEGYVRERIKWLKWATKQEGLLTEITADVLNTVPGADAVEWEKEKVNGRTAAELYATNHGLVIQDGEKSGNWYTFKTGRQILKFPCSYCAYKSRCYPHAKMEMKGDKPVWVVS